MLFHQALRAAAIRLGPGSGYASADFNAFLRQNVKEPFSKGRHARVWEMLVQEEVTLISSAEVADSSVSAAEAKSFLSADEPVAAAAPVAAPAEDDLFGAME